MVPTSATKKHTRKTPSGVESRAERERSAAVQQIGASNSVRVMPNVPTPELSPSCVWRRGVFLQMSCL